MNENRDIDPRADGDQALGADLAAAIGKRSESLDRVPPVAGVIEQAAAAASARRRRHTLVGIAAAVSLLAGGLITWNTLRDNGEAGSSHVATGPAVSDRAKSTAGGSPPVGEGVDPAAAQFAGRSTDDTAATDQRTDDPPAVDDAHLANMETLAEPDPLAADSPAAEPQPPEQPATGTGEGVEDPPGESAEPVQSVSTPEEPSTGAPLTWTEVSFDTRTAFGDVHRIESVGDGRIVGRDLGGLAGQYVVTRDGATWTPVPTPPGITPEHIDISGDRWVVAGVDITLDYPHRVYYSDDEGATWTELLPDIAPDSETRPAYCVERWRVRSALASQDRIVVVAHTDIEFDLPVLLTERGLVPDRQSVLQWHHTDGAVALYVDKGSKPEWIEVPHSELGMASGESPPCAGFDGTNDQRVRIYASDGSVTEPVVEYEAEFVTAVSTNEGFFILFRRDGTNLAITSTDGRHWSEDHPPHIVDFLARGPGDTVWSAGRPHIIQRADIGERPRTFATFDDQTVGEELAAGPAGVTATAWRWPSGDSNIVPEVQFTKDGYELRINQPPGGMTLWDLSEDVAIYAFESVARLPGVRTRIDNGSVAVVFDDPDTGANLVAFAAEDLAPEVVQLIVLGRLSSRQSWIGWSVDGTDWRWQPATEAFGIDPSDLAGQPLVDLAVGEDFLLARVELVAVSDVVAADVANRGAGPYVTPDSTTRWFIARVPQCRVREPC